jgi:hypothetical protein
MFLGAAQQQARVALPPRELVFYDDFDLNTAELTEKVPNIGVSWGEKEVDGTGDPLLYTNDYNVGSLYYKNVANGVVRYFENPSYTGSVVAQVGTSFFGLPGDRDVEQFLLYNNIDNHLRIRIQSDTNMRLYCRESGVDGANLLNVLPPTVSGNHCFMVILNIPLRALRLYTAGSTTVHESIGDWTLTHEVLNLPSAIQSMATKAGVSSVQGGRYPSTPALSSMRLYSHTHDWWA